MKIFLRRISFVVLAVFTVLDAFAGAPPQWVEVRSPHFSVYSDAGEKRGREVALRFEQMRAVFGSLMVKAKVNTAVPLQIVAFRNTKELRQFAPLWKGKPTEVSGLFVGGDDRTFILLDMSAYDPWQVVFHEYGHQLMNGTVAMEMDPWFDEGFAEYFSSIEVDDKEARVGKIPDTTYDVLRGGMTKVGDLFKVAHQSQTYLESGDRRNTFYAQSAMMVHYLYDNQLIPKLSVYFDLKMAKGVPVEDAVQKAFGMSVAQLDKALRDYTSAGRYNYYKIASPGKIDSKLFEMQPVTQPEASAVLAEIHQVSLDYSEKAVSEFEEVLKADPANATALRGLGYAYLRKSDFDKASEYFQRAAKANSKDYRVHYYAALALTRRDGFSDSAIRDEAKKELETSIALNPDFSDSYMLLAFTQSFGGDQEKALATALKGVSRSPRNENHLFNLAQMYLRNMQPDKALPLLQSLQRSANPQLASAVQTTLLQAQEFKEHLRRRNEETEPEVVAEKTSFEQRVFKAPAEESAEPEPPSAPPDPKRTAPIKFLKGTITNVDCSAPPSATVLVNSGAKNWKMTVSDIKKVLVMGADTFSCSWKKQKVAVNYREQGEAEGTVVSLEIQ